LELVTSPSGICFAVWAGRWVRPEWQFWKTAAAWPWR